VRGGAGRSGPGRVEPDHHLGAQVAEERGVEGRPEPPPASGAVFGPLLAGREVASWGREEEDAARHDDAHAPVDRAGWTRGEPREYREG
jgi:hypothetical protein